MSKKRNRIFAGVYILFALLFFFLAGAMIIEGIGAIASKSQAGTIIESGIPSQRPVYEVRLKSNGKIIQVDGQGTCIRICPAITPLPVGEQVRVKIRDGSAEFTSGWVGQIFVGLLPAAVGVMLASIANQRLRAK